MWASIWNDIITMIRELRAVDFAQPTYLALWVGITLLPLKGIDRRDTVSMLDYAMFMSFAGVALLFALPKHYIDAPSTETQIAVFLVLIGVSMFRWRYKAVIDVKIVEAKRPNTSLQGVNTDVRAKER